MKRIITSLAFAACVAAPQGPALAVTDGDADGTGHPHVGLLIFDVGGAPAWRCSGTLISPTIIVTAGHCTYGATGGRVWFAPDVQGNPHYPFFGPSSIEFAVGGIATHQDYDDNAFFLHDVGMVKLSEPVVLPVYGVLPQADQLDALKSQKGAKQTFTAVGYGLQRAFPEATDWKEVRLRTRMVATPRLIQINVPGATGDFSMLLSNNANTGGTCFGDSGGPNFLNDGSGNVIAGVTSYAKNQTCAGTGGVFRLDRQNVLDFIADFIAEHP